MTFTNLNSIIAKSLLKTLKCIGNQKVTVLFYAEWCGHCKTLMNGVWGNMKKDAALRKKDCTVLEIEHTTIDYINYIYKLEKENIKSKKTLILTKKEFETLQIIVDIISSSVKGYPTLISVDKMKKNKDLNYETFEGDRTKENLLKFI